MTTEPEEDEMILCTKCGNEIRAKYQGKFYQWVDAFGRVACIAGGVHHR